MKVAMTVWEDRISPVFDSARNLLVADIENGETVKTSVEALHTEPALRRPAKLFDLGVCVLICGAISEPLAGMIEGYGIRLFPFITGSAARVLDAYLKGALVQPVFHMPGCGGSRRPEVRGQRSEVRGQKLETGN
jgi:predicted Fe-Mo cluster-binding NifX family protein